MSKKRKYPIVEVVWEDHKQETEDMSLKKAIRKCVPSVGTYLGYLVHEDKKMVVLVNNIWDDGDISSPMYILKKVIITRSDVK